MKLRIAEERIEARQTIKIVGGDGGVPMDFAFWLQLKEVAPYDTRMRLVLHIDLNMMMSMMIGSQDSGCDRPDRRRHRSRDAGAGVGRQL